jgi:N-methylhydantoinase A
MIARELRMSTVIIPRAPGHFSAIGMLVADLRRDFVRTWFMALAEAPLEEIEQIYAGMEREGRAAIASSRLDLQKISLTRSADMRYIGQEHAVTVDLPMELFVKQDRAAIKAHFDSVHAKRYGYANEGESAEIVSLRSAVAGHLHKPPMEEIRQGEASPPQAAFCGNRPVYFKEEEGFLDTPTFDRLSLLGGNRIEGPALIEEYASTTVVHPDDVVDVDRFGNLVVTIGRSGR